MSAAAHLKKDGSGGLFPTPLLISFPGGEHATLAEVGGKAYSLIRMAEAGLPVPPGVVLTTAFFAPWFDQIKTTASWAALAGATPERWPALCHDLKERCPALPLMPEQQRALEDLRAVLEAQSTGGLFAVRSSSPEEDLTSASFAGGYETRLGARLADLEDAVRHCFASSLDARVFVYKKEHGFDVLAPRIAVVVQQQIDSEVAGVGFSLNPLTNDYDEAVIDANWGLGESVVAGLASPDHFIVDKVARNLVEETIGEKQISIWLDGGGGTTRRENHRSAERTLTDAQLVELTDVMTRIEALYEKPMDIEWAYAGGHLYVLQARPITTYVPLPPEMMTTPGQRRMLYTDIALSSGLTINAPISPMGLAWMEENITSLGEMFFGSVDLALTFEEKFWFFAGGRMYQNLSNVMWLANPKKMAKAGAASDALMSEILATIDAKRYRSAKRPPWAKLRMLRYMPRVLWRMRSAFGNTLGAILAPERARRRYQEKTEIYETELIGKIDYSLPLDEFRQMYALHNMHYLFGVTMAERGVSQMVSVDLETAESYREAG